MALVGATAAFALLLFLGLMSVANPHLTASSPTASPDTAPLGGQPVTALLVRVATMTATPEVFTAVPSSESPSPTPVTGPASNTSPPPDSPTPQTVILLPAIPNGSQVGTAAVTSPGPATPAPTSSPAPAGLSPPPNVPAPTRGPLRITKLGMGVYDSGGGMYPTLDDARPSVILLMDPSVGWATEIRRRFPKAFIIGRIFTADQPLDNPTQRGGVFADRVAATAVPLKGIVDAWMSYNEIGSPDHPDTMVAYNAFQVAFAQRLQDHYGIAAVAGNDGPRAVPAELYPRYYADAIRASRYFGVHIYPDPGVRSLQDPAARDQVFYYRKIKAALDAAGVKSGPFIATEIGLYAGWRDVVNDTDMANDFTWVADQMNADPYVIGMTVFGLFTPDRWKPFNIEGSNIPRILGDYNTVR